MSVQSNHSNFALESQLIIACAQTTIPAPQVERIDNILRQQLDWKYIFDVSVRNAVNPVVVWNLLRNFNQLLPEEIKKTLNREFQEHTRHNMFLTRKLIDIIGFFNSNDIPILSFKGPLLANHAYGNLALRQFGDLDILLPPKYLEAGIKLLMTNGYTPTSSLSWLYKTNWNMSRKKDVGFISDDKNVLLELHWKLSGSHFAVPFEMSRLWQELETVDLAGIKVNTLSFNDLLIYLCLHGAKHSWERFGWICDINELIRSEKDINWELVNSEAKRLGCENTLALGLCLLNEFFDLEVPTPILQKIENDSTFREIVADIRARLFAPEMISVEMGDRYLYQLKLKEKFWDRWKLHLHYIFWYLKIIFTPNTVDKNLFQLPRWLAPLYLIMRPLRLFYTYVVMPKKIEKSLKSDLPRKTN